MAAILSQPQCENILDAQLAELSLLSCSLVYSGLNKMTNFSSRPFHIHYVSKNICILIQISLKFVPMRPTDNKSALVSGNGLVPNRWQAITWTNVYRDVWCHVLLSQNKLTVLIMSVNSLRIGPLSLWQKLGRTDRMSLFVYAKLRGKWLCQLLYFLCD